MARPLGADIFEGAIFKASNGVLEIIKYHHAKKVLVKFAVTGFETFAASDNIMRGKVKDLMAPTVCGIAFLGGTKFSQKNNKKAYFCWQNMIRRCYSDIEQKKCPTYIGCTVCREWLNFQTFCEWYNSNTPNDGGKYQIDKDIKVKGNRVYSPLTCKLVTAQENLAEMCDRALSRRFIFANKDGHVIKIRNLSRFCKDNDLDLSNMSAIHRLKGKSYKGWRRVLVPILSGVRGQK